MKTLRARLDRLEGKRGTADAEPAVILICDAVSGEPIGALLKAREGLTRKAGETAEAFEARASSELRRPGAGR